MAPRCMHLSIPLCALESSFSSLTIASSTPSTRVSSEAPLMFSRSSWRTVTSRTVVCTCLLPPPPYCTAPNARGVVRLLGGAQANAFEPPCDGQACIAAPFAARRSQHLRRVLGYACMANRMANGSENDTRQPCCAVLCLLHPACRAPGNKAPASELRSAKITTVVHGAVRCWSCWRRVLVLDVG